MSHGVLPVADARALTDFEEPPLAARDRHIGAWSGAIHLVFAVTILLCAHHAGDSVLPVAVGMAAAVLLLVRMVLGVARARLAGAAGFCLLSAVPLAVLAATVGDGRDLRLGATLVALGTVPLVAATVPAMTFRHLDQARREDITPALVLSACCGGLGILVAIASAQAVGVTDGRLSALVPYLASGMALLGMAEVLGTHRAGAGFADTVVVVAAGAVGVEALLLAGQHAGVADAVTAATVGGAVAAVGLVMSTAVATPRPLVVPVEEAADGPRYIAGTLALLVVIAAILRLLSMHPPWLDEADTARLSGSSFSNLQHAAAEGHAHPPLLAGLVWLSRQVFGSADLALRLPSLAAGVLLVPAVYVAAEKLFDRRVGLITAAIVAVGPGFVWLSGEADPGALAALLVTVSMLTLVVALRRNRMTDWVFFGFAAALLLWSHQLAVVPVAIMHVAALIALRSRDGWDVRRDAARPVRPGPARWGVAVLIDIVAFVALVVYRHGFGPADVLPPFEYATRAAPGAGRSVFGLTGAALAGLVGFHPADVTSRLLALWPLCMLAAFVMMGRSWSRRGALVVALALAPLAALLVLQIAGSPRNPPFALTWTAIAMPMLAVASACAMARARSWRTVRLMSVAVVAVLVVATIDQRVRVTPLPRYDISAAVEDVHDRAREGDAVVYAPEDIGDLVRHEVRGATVVSAANPGDALTNAKHVYALGAFAWRKDDPDAQKLLDLVHQLSGQRTLTRETGTDEAKVWTFS